ncbi:MAG TPA: outer membrane beta-barrel protein [Chryseosolibacter sp.]|nr:outer membrane beta-barrel protein [Chryseosolibacter sp.]
MRKRVFLLLLVIATAVPFVAESQSFYAVRRDRNFLLGAGSGIAYYQGDMVDPREFGKVKPNIAVTAEYYILPRISVRAGATWFQTAGSDKTANDDRVERNLHFRSSNWEVNMTAAVSLIPNGSRFYQRPGINLHAFIGVGMLHFNPKAEYQGEWHALAPLETEGVKYSRFQPVIPFGLGARIKVDPFFNVLIEGGYRKTFTDYLDDVSSTRYPDPAILKSDLSRALSDRRPEIGTQPSRPTEVGKRGNPANDDGYFIMNVTLQYYMPTEIFRTQRKLYTQKRKANRRKR